MSKGEEKVAALFKKSGVPFKREVKFQDLKGLKGELLRFDFAVFDQKGQLVSLIEIDGQQHFKQVKHFQKTVFDLKKTKEWDRRKNAYCLRKQIPLIRIPYWDLDKLTLERILTNPEYRVRSMYHNDYLCQEVR